MRNKTLISAIILSSMVIPAKAQVTLAPGNIDEVLKAMTLEEKATLCVGGSRTMVYQGIPTGYTNIVPGAAGNTRAIDRLGIPNTILADGPAGLRISPTREVTNRTYYCTGFPVGTLLASSWDLDLMEKVTTAMGEEVLEYGVDVLLAPGMNIHRNPLCGRNFEYFSEDPVLSGNMAAAYVKGIQSNGVGTSIKHFAANNQEIHRRENDAIVSPRALREIYLKNFEIAVKKAAPWTVMSSYNKLDGYYTQQSHDLLTKVLRDDWGFEGIVMTDWGNKEGTVNAVIAGNDLMEPGNQNEIDRMVNAVKDGSLPIEDLDRNVRRILEYIVKTPHFRKYPFSENPDLKGHAKIARDAASESIVLLRNEGATLPLKGVSKIALYGVGSVDFVAGGTGSGNVNKAYVVNLKDAFENAGFKLDQGLVDAYDGYYKYFTALDGMTRVPDGFATPKLTDFEIPAQAIEKQAGNNDLAVIVYGRNAGEGTDRPLSDFELSPVERNLVHDVSEAFHKAGKKVIVILNVGGVIETSSWKGMTDAILLPWSPGQEGANSVVDILTGKVNPSGKLPMTFPVNYFDNPSSVNFPYNIGRGTTSNGDLKNFDYTRYEEGIYVGYRYFETAKKEVSYPFGFGLSYTTFGYSKPTVKATNDGFVATITVTNTGNVAGKEAVQLYVTAPSAGLDKPALELKSFAKTKELRPGESQTLTMEVSSYDLASFNQDKNRWESAKGDYTVRFGASVRDIRATAIYKQAKDLYYNVSTSFQGVSINELIF